MPTVAELAQQELDKRYSLQGRTQVAPRPQTMQNVRPTIRSALSNLMRDAVDATGLEDGYRQGLLNAAGDVESAVDFLPVVGDAIAVDDAARAYEQGDMLGAGINMMSVVPVVGDVARSALRSGPVGKRIDDIRTNRARMQRAQDLGFDTSRPLYHSTNASFDSFEIPEGGFLKYGKGVYTTPKPQYADRYIRENRDLDRAYKEGANVMPLYARGNIATEQDWEAARQDMMSEGVSPSGYNQQQAELQRRLKEQGFDGLNMFGDEIIIFDPKNIRSTNAEFDPTKADSADLLSSVGTTSALRGIA